MPATSPAAKEKHRARVRAKMAMYRRDYPEKATATLRMCYWKKRVRQLTARLAAAEQQVIRWTATVERLRWRHE